MLGYKKLKLEVKKVTDRRAGKRSGHHIPSKGGAQPRSRTKSGKWKKNVQMLKVPILTQNTNRSNFS